jgi:hypothetical protein
MSAFATVIPLSLTFAYLKVSAPEPPTSRSRLAFPTSTSFWSPPNRRSLAGPPLTVLAASRVPARNAFPEPVLPTV